MTAKTHKEIQKDYRDRNRQRLADNNARVIRFEVYPGTDKVIKKMCALGGFEDEKEMLTILLRNVNKLSMVEVDELLKI